jgi:signal transduction histidine kinase
MHERDPAGALRVELAAMEARARAAEERVRALEARLAEVAAEAEAQHLADTSQLAAGVVHELNNPLTAVTIFSESLTHKLERSRVADDADLEKLRTIREAGDRLLRFSRELTGYARPIVERADQVDVAEALDEAIRGCRAVLARRAARVERRFAAVQPLHAVRASLVVAFGQLVTNAAQALRPDGGVVGVELAPLDGGERVVVRIVDDGAGMTPDVEQQLFRPFFSTKTDGETGLGLCIAQRVVRRHGGTIAIATAPGQGTAVTVTLPRRAPL